ncbi:MAG: exosortase-associated EpsI family protein [Deltaproteobacteria bacterium]|nr:exosortase-associated EpsI family protein [Deltaproteobacteria bacterium]
MGESSSVDSPASGAAAGSAGSALVPGGDRGALLWLLCCAGLAVAAYRELLWFQPERSLSDELEQWFFVPSQSITPVVLLMSLWLLYRCRARLRSLPPARGSALTGAALLVAGGAIHLWATYTGASDLLVPSLMLNGLAAAWLWKGGAALRVVLLPVAFLAFAMPLPAPLLNEVIFRLQIWTTELAGASLYAFGIPHLVAGEQIQRTENTFSVIESCAGLRSMETLTIVAILMIDLFRRRGLHAWLVVLAAPPVAFLMNGLRAVLLILNPHSQIAAIHNLQGVAILLSGLVVLSLWDGGLERLARLRGAEPPRPACPPEGMGERKERGRWPWAVAAALALAAGASFWLPRWEAAPAEALDASRRIPGRLGLSTELKIDRLFLGSAGFRESFARRFAAGGDPVMLFVGIGSRSDRHRSALSPKTGFPGSGWIVEHEGRTILDPDGREVRARLLRSGSRRYLVYHWYEGSLGWPVELLRSLLALDRSPWRRPQEIVAIQLGVPVLGPVPRGRPDAEKRLLSFYHQLRPLLDRLESESGGLASNFRGKGFPEFPDLGKDFPPGPMACKRSSAAKSRG